MPVRVKPRRYWRHPTAGPVPDTIPGVDARVNFITLAVADVAASRRFYVDGLGWSLSFEEPGEVIFFRVSPTLILALWSAAAFEGEVGAITRRDGHPPFTLAHNVPAQEQVDIVLATAAAAGATVLEAGTPREWGGYTGYFSDPDGFVWEVAYNPGRLGVALMEATAGGAVEATATTVAQMPDSTTVDVIRTRRSVAQAKLVGGHALDHREVVEAVESARWAPNHKRTEPWRFFLLDEGRKGRLADLWGEQLERTGSAPERAAAKRDDWANAPGVVIVTATSRTEADEVMRLEDYAATACAVQNLCLHLWSKGIATKWSTAGVTQHEGFWPLLGHVEQPADTRVVAVLFYGLVEDAPKAHRKLGVAEVLVDFRHEAR